MGRLAARVIGILAVVLAAQAVPSAHGVQYPPGPGGPGGAYPDTLIRVNFIQNPAAVPHPVQPDTVWGIGGIITGLDTAPTGFALYIQNSQGGPWSGVGVFTGSTNYAPLYTPNLVPGDSVMCYGRLGEFEGGLEIRSFASGSPFSPPLPIVRRISQGHALPPFFRGTVSELQELPTNILAEQHEGCLVRVKDKLRVVRTSLQPVGIGTSSSMLVVGHTNCPNGSIGPCDSVFIDGSTLSFNAVTPLPLGALIDSVQGIFEQRARGYRVQLRSFSDLFDSSPPSLIDAYFISSDTIRAVFDRNVTLASAQNVLNYTLYSTLGPPDAAIRQVQTNLVHLKVTSGLGAGDQQGLTVNGLVNSANGHTMTVAGSRTMYEGVTPISQVQAPDPAALSASPCQDRSRFAGIGSTNGDRITVRGVCTASYGPTHFIQDPAGGARSGLQVFAPLAPLVPGRQYLLAGAILEFFNETQLSDNVFVKDEGMMAVPAPVVRPIGVLRDTTCDNTGSDLGTQSHLSTAEDYEGMLVRLVDVKTVEEGNTGWSFGVAGPYPVNADTILVGNDIPRTFDPALGQYVSVTGVLELTPSLFAGVRWRIQPRGDADIVINPAVGVEYSSTTAISFVVAPNPARAPRVTFTLPSRDHVRIAVYDVAGRKLAVVADGDYGAGRHEVGWEGRDLSGNRVRSGLYFYKATVGTQTLERRGFLID